MSSVQKKGVDNMVFSAADIRQYVLQHSNETVECLQKLIQTPSITGDEIAVSKIFNACLQDAGFEPKIIGISPEHPNVLAEWAGSRPGKRFLFNGHMDTFPPPREGESMFPPFDAVISDGFVYGRGANDMKGGDAAALMAVKFLREMGFDPTGTIILGFTCDEQNGGRYGVKWLIENGYLNADFGICMEPTRARIMLGHMGILNFKVSYTAPTGVSSRYHPTGDALEKSVRAINALYQLRDNVVKIRKCPYYGRPVLNITTIHSGTAQNMWPGNSEFIINRRIVPGETEESVTTQLLDVLNKLQAAYPEMDYNIERLSYRPILHIPDDSQFIRQAMEAYREITGKECTCYYRPGGSDAANIFEAYGTHIPNWGAAVDQTIDGFGAGQPNERILINDYLESIMYYMLTLVKTMS